MLVSPITIHKPPPTVSNLPTAPMWSSCACGQDDDVAGMSDERPSPVVGHPGEGRSGEVEAKRATAGVTESAAVEEGADGLQATDGALAPVTALSRPGPAL